MDAIVRDVIIPRDHKLKLEVELPPDIPEGEAEVTVTVKSKNGPRKRQNSIVNMRGKYKGRIWMADDFDAPLEDFAEYM